MLVSIALATLIAAGCASVIGLETSSTVVPDASMPADAGAVDANGQEDPADGEVMEASAEACAPTARVSPSTTEAVVTTSGKTCGLPDAVLEADGITVFGLDDNPDATANEIWNGKFVTGCIGLGFTGGPFRAITVRTRAVNDACGNACVVIPDAGCGSGQWFGLFVRKGSDPQWIATTQITSTFDEYTVSLPPSVGVDPYLYVCRASANRTRDDVQVDYVAACR